METWQILEQILNKPLEKIVDVISGNWLCGICPGKQKFFSKEAILKAARDKTKTNTDEK